MKYESGHSSQSGPLKITNFAEATDILGSADFAQCGHNVLHDAPITTDTLISLHGDAHLSRRRLENPLFRKSLLRSWELVDLESALSLEIERRRAPAADHDLTVDLLSLTRRSLLPVTAALIGLRDASQEVAVEVLDRYAEIFAPAAALRAMPSQDQDRIRREALEAEETFRIEVFTSAWEERMRVRAERLSGLGDGEQESKDLLATIVDALPDLPVDQVLREVLLFIVASTDTTTLAVASTFFHLEKWIREHPTDGDRRTDAQFLQACAFESVRLHPPPPLDRVAVKDGCLRSGRLYQAGDLFAVAIADANRDPSVFGIDASEFNPYRPQPIGARPYGLAFGGGPHMCIGRTMAISNAQLDDTDPASGAIGTVLRMLLRLYEEGVRLNPKDLPVWRQGPIQERFTSFPVVLPAVRPLASTGGGNL